MGSKWTSNLPLDGKTLLSIWFYCGDCWGIFHRQLFWAFSNWVAAFAIWLPADVERNSNIWQSSSTIWPVYGTNSSICTRFIYSSSVGVLIAIIIVNYFSYKRSLHALTILVRGSKWYAPPTSSHGDPEPQWWFYKCHHCFVFLKTGGRVRGIDTDHINAICLSMLVSGKTWRDSELISSVYLIASYWSAFILPMSWWPVYITLGIQQSCGHLGKMGISAAYLNAPFNRSNVPTCALSTIPAFLVAIIEDMISETTRRKNLKFETMKPRRLWPQNWFENALTWTAAAAQIMCAVNHGYTICILLLNEVWITWFTNFIGCWQSDPHESNGLESELVGIDQVAAIHLPKIRASNAWFSSFVTLLLVKVCRH